MPKITKFGSKLIVEAMKFKKKNTVKKTFDLEKHKGERVRVHINTDGEYSIDTKARQNLLVCELELPEREYEHTKKVINGETVIESKEKKLKLGEISMIEYVKEEIKK